MSRSSRSDPLRDIGIAYEGLYAALGKALAEWSYIEDELSKWFHAISGMPKQMANDIFYAASSFENKTNLARAVLRNTQATDTEKNFAKAVFSKAQAYSEFRNAFVHGHPAMKFASDDTPIACIVQPYGRSRETESRVISIEQLTVAAGNFRALSALMVAAKFASLFKQVPTADEALLSRLQMQVQQLPNAPESTEPSQKQLGRLRQQRAAARIPRPKRRSDTGP